jgi:hypothetical protein
LIRVNTTAHDGPALRRAFLIVFAMPGSDVFLEQKREKLCLISKKALRNLK